jgi:hypothetical protein
MKETIYTEMPVFKHHGNIIIFDLRYYCFVVQSRDWTHKGS